MEVKFRVWADGEMYQHDDHEFMVGGEGRLFDAALMGDHVYDIMPDGQRVGVDPTLTGEVLLWTGCQDQNGVDIYEGDIVELDHLRGVVEWRPPAFQHRFGQQVAQCGDGGPERIYEIDLQKVRDLCIPFEDVVDEDGNLVARGVQPSLREQIAKIESDNAKAVIFPDFVKVRQLRVPDFSQCIVLGNRYENPNLLEWLDQWR